MDVHAIVAVSESSIAERQRTMNIHDALKIMTRDELIALLTETTNDPFTGIMNAAGAKAFHSRIPENKALLFIDMCNVHAMNHKYTMNGTNKAWMNIFADNRLEDVLIKWGGDEFVVIIDRDTLEGYLTRLQEKMIANDVYAIVAIVTTSNSLQESVNRADDIVSSAKYMQELNGMKPGRDEAYSMGDTHIIYE